MSLPSDDAESGGDRFCRLTQVGSSLLSELDLEAVLRQVVEAARELIGAEFAALGVLDVIRAPRRYPGRDDRRQSRRAGDRHRPRGDDHAVVRGALRALLDAEPDLEVAAEATDVAAAREAAAFSPDVLVLDANLSDGSASMPSPICVRATRTPRSSS